MMYNSRISIITPVYNSAPWLGEMLDSVRKQTFQNWEHLLVDDGSTDGSDQIIASTAATDPRIRLFRMPENGGPAKARNLGIDKASGRYLAFLDADDLWLEQKLELCLQFMRGNRYPFVYHAFRYLSSDSKSTGGVVRGPAELNYRTLHVRRGIGDCMSVMIDRELIPDFRFVNHQGKTHEDWQTWLCLVKNGHKGHLLDKDLGRYRKSDGSRNASKLAAARLVWRLYREYEKLPFPQAANWWAQYAWNSFWLQLRSKPPVTGKKQTSRLSCVPTVADE
jgi:glycosyltransferase involved in cell wall biosynthesis